VPGGYSSISGIRPESYARIYGEGVGGFRVAGIPVRIDPTFLLVAVFLGLGRHTGAMLVAWVGVVVLSVLVHELGHAFAFRRYGQQPQILLAGMGGLTSGSGEPLTPRRELVVSLAGPLTPVVTLALPALFLLRSDVALGTAVETVLADIVFANIAWSVLNLLPVLPLDGGHVAASLIGLATGRPGDRPAQVLSIVVGVGGAAVGLAAGYAFSAMLAGFLVAYNVGQISAARNQGLARGLLEGWAAMVRGDHSTAAAAARAALADRPSRDVMTDATELLAWARLRSEGADAAEETLLRIPHGVAPNPALLGAVALARGRREEAIDRYATAYAERRHGPHSPVAVDRAAAAGIVDGLAARLLEAGSAGADRAADLAVHLHIAGRYDEAARVGERALHAQPSNPGQVAYNLACSRARAGDGREALWWLERAADEGFADGDVLDRDRDLDSVRDDERYREIRARMGRRQPDR
jgi:Zn-dependent protease